MEEERERETEQRLGRYVLEERLAEGGMAHVYRARSLGAAGVVKELCIKRVAAEVLGSERAVARFIEEARLSMQLSHGNIVSVFDFGRADDGYYLAMEWVDGVDLSALLARGDEAPSPFPSSVVAHVGAEVARALHHAHAHGPTGGVVHRDVKPSNVLLSRAGEVKLGDFGVAVVLGSSRTIAGTPGYMAPEQARGEAVDERADIFGLGKVLLEMAVGRRVDDVTAALAGIDPELRALVAPMLAPRPEDRPADAKQVASALERISSRAVTRGEEAPRDVLSARVQAKARARGAAVDAPMEDLESFAATVTESRPTTIDAPSVGAHEPPAGVAPRSAPGRTRFTAVAITVAVVVAAAGVAAALTTREATTRLSPPDEATTAIAGAPAPRPVPRPTPVEAAPSPAPVEPPRSAEPAPEGEAPAPPVEAPAPAPTKRAPVHRERAARGAPSPQPTEPPAAAPAPAEGVLNVAARPWAHVFIDGRRVGTTPVLGLRVPAGSHAVRLENDALGVTRALTVDVPAEGRRNVSVDLL